MLASENLCRQDENNLVLRGRCKYVHLKNHWVLEIMQQNIAVILWQLYYSKISFKGFWACEILTCKGFQYKRRRLWFTYLFDCAVLGIPYWFSHFKVKQHWTVPIVPMWWRDFRSKILIQNLISKVSRRAKTSEVRTKSSSTTRTTIISPQPDVYSNNDKSNVDGGYVSLSC